MSMRSMVTMGGYCRDFDTSFWYHLSVQQYVAVKHWIAGFFSGDPIGTSHYSGFVLATRSCPWSDCRTDSRHYRLGVIFDFPTAHRAGKRHHQRRFDQRHGIACTTGEYRIFRCLFKDVEPNLMDKMQAQSFVNSDENHIEKKCRETWLLVCCTRK